MEILSGGINIILAIHSSRTFLLFYLCTMGCNRNHFYISSFDPFNRICQIQTKDLCCYPFIFVQCQGLQFQLLVNGTCAPCSTKHCHDCSTDYRKCLQVLAFLLSKIIYMGISWPYCSALYLSIYSFMKRN